MYLLEVQRAEYASTLTSSTLKSWRESPESLLWNLQRRATWDLALMSLPRITTREPRKCLGSMILMLKLLDIQTSMQWASSLGSRYSLEASEAGSLPLVVVYSTPLIYS
uniref:Uncharacterized protein n=1 Tax=Cacopsylla melanoneura TaxID=428564 RepID=A0A8D9FET0_9HEMI